MDKFTPTFYTYHTHALEDIRQHTAVGQHT